MCLGLITKRKTILQSFLLSWRLAVILLDGFLIQKLKKELYDILAYHSGKDYDTIWKDSDRDYWMIAQEAKEYGLIDEVLIKKTT